MFATVVPYCHLTLLAVALAVSLLFVKGVEKYLGKHPKRTKLIVLVVLAFIAADALAGWTWWAEVGQFVQEGSEGIGLP